MNMKYFKLKYIVTVALIIVLGVGTLMFFVGALTPSSIEYGNTPFNEEGFLDIQQMVKEGKTLNTNKVVGETDELCLLINEDTTELTLLQKGVNWSEENPTDGNVLYTTANVKEAVNDTEKSNIIVNYYDSKNKVNTLDSYNYSVAYENQITGEILKYYKLRYLEDEKTVDILYQIGKFSNVNKLFPAMFDRSAFENLFVGNTVFDTIRFADIKDADPVSIVNDETGETIQGKEIKYGNTGKTFDEKIVEYLTGLNLDITCEPEYTYYQKEKVVAYYNIKGLLDDEGKFKLKAGVHYNCEGSPITTNPFLPYMILESAVYNAGYKLVKGTTEVTYDENVLNHHIGSSPTFELEDALPTTLNAMQKALYGGGQYVHLGYPLYYDFNGDGELTYDEAYNYGGYHARDEEGKFLYDEETGRPVQVGMTQEDVDNQNDMFGLSDEAKETSFQIALRVKLTVNGMECTILNDSIWEKDGSLGYISLFPTMTVNKDVNSEGQIIIPDGSGAVISFNSEKDDQKPQKYVEKRIYGTDLTIPEMTQSAFARDIMLGMYGFIEQSEGKGLVVIADKGAAQTSIEADFLRKQQTGTYNYARFNTYFRESEEVQISTNNSYTKISRDIYQQDIVYRYDVLLGEDLTYVDVANAYRTYLIEKYTLNKNGDTTTSNNVSINFLGAFTKKQIALGYVYDAELSLTTFKEAMLIVDELRENGVKNMNVSYSFWTEDEMSPEITTKLNVSKELGGKKDLKALSKHLQEIGVNFYPEYNTVTGSGYDKAFGVMKYSSKSVSGSYSEIPSFVLSTGQANAEVGPQNVISPRFYKAVLDKFISNTEKVELNGLYLSNLGSQRTADYAKKVQIYSGISTQYQIDALASAKESLGNIMLSAPFDYAIQYASYATNVPTGTTMYPIFDYAIPLYQLVLSGIVDYSSEYVNYNNDNSDTYNLLKAIETGSNLSYMLSYTDTSILLDTNHTAYYNSYYSNWSNKIVSMNNELNKSGIYNGYLVNHEYITDNVVKVQYQLEDSVLTIYINYDKTNYQDPVTGLTVRSNWYTVL